ncbi:hypothetical protein E5288_WYG002139 [Bos mutus]|uniref:Uncharacterized protein n=1 Tax=Bos mutus TaxID=72004 RepID=A0A6B0SGN3_9CETA|nr:hypothetical protein [Bos mutus]
MSPPDPAARPGLKLALSSHRRARSPVFSPGLAWSRKTSSADAPPGPGAGVCEEDPPGTPDENRLPKDFLCSFKVDTNPPQSKKLRISQFEGNP